MAALISLIAVVVLSLIAFTAGFVDQLRFAFGVLIPGIAFVVFVVFLILRMLKWAKVPVPFRIPTVSGQAKSLPWIKNQELESPSGWPGVIGRMALEVLLFRSLFRNHKVAVLPDKTKVTYTSSKLLWFAAFVFHWCMLLVVFRHLRFFVEPVPACVNLWESLDGFMQVGLPVIYVTTAGMLAGLLVLLGRRLINPQVRYISLPSDYFALFLLLGIAASGAVMRHVEKIDIVQVKAAVASAFSLHAVVPTGVGSIYFVHVMLVSALLLYLPFSKLLHMPGVFFSPTRNLANNNRQRHHVNPWNPRIPGHSYKEWEDEFRDKMKASGYVLEEE